MKSIHHFIQFIFIIFFYFVYKVLGLKISRKISSFIFLLIGPKFRSKIISKKNLSKAFPTINEDEKDKGDE